MKEQELYEIGRHFETLGWAVRRMIENTNRPPPERDLGAQTEFYAMASHIAARLKREADLTGNPVLCSLAEAMTLASTQVREGPRDIFYENVPLKYVALPARQVDRYRPRPKYGKKTWGKSLHELLQNIPGYHTEARAREIHPANVPLSVFRLTSTGYEHKDTTWSDHRWCSMSFA